MTIAGRRGALTKGSAKLLIRILRGQSGLKPDWRSCYKPEAKHQSLIVEFNTKDELELQFTLDKDEIPKINKENLNIVNSYDGRVSKIESFKIEEIIDCVAIETEDFINTLVVETIKRNVKEDLVLKFDNEQEFRRTLFTYKYFKMRNRLANSSTSSDNNDGSSSPSLSTKSKSSISSNDASPIITNNFVKGFDFTAHNGKSHFLKTYNNFNNNNNNDFLPNYSSKSLDYLSINGQIQKNKMAYEQKINEMNNINVTKNFGNENKDITATNHKYSNGNDSSKSVGEIDGLIYTDIEYESMDYNSLSYGSNFSNNLANNPLKPQRRKQVLRRIKGRAPPPPRNDKDVIKEQLVKVNVERAEKFPTKEVNTIATKTLPTVPRVQIAPNGYESDREEWRSRSTFSSSAFHSLARPARRALAAYYRISSPSPIPAPQQMTLKPSPRNPRNLQEFPKNFINSDYVILSHMQDKRVNYQQDLHQHQNMQQKQELKYGKMLFNQDYKRSTLGGSMSYLNISSKLHGITDKIKEIGHPNHTIKPNWQRVEKDKKEKGHLKPVIKKNPTQLEGSKRPVVRTCSAEPPKKVTFSAFATVQVV